MVRAQLNVTVVWGHAVGQGRSSVHGQTVFIELGLHVLLLSELRLWKGGWLRGEFGSAGDTCVLPLAYD